MTEPLVNINKTGPAVIKLMLQYKLTPETVGERANCTPDEIRSALHLSDFAMCPFILVARVRRAVEQELFDRGWTGRGKELWKEFDAKFKKLPMKS